MLATVIDLSRLGDAAAIVEHVEATKAHIRTSRAPGSDEVLLPGEPESRTAQERAATGIPVDATTWPGMGEAAGGRHHGGEIDPAVGAN